MVELYQIWLFMRSIVRINTGYAKFRFAQFCIMGGGFALSYAQRSFA